MFLILKTTTDKEYLRKLEILVVKYCVDLLERTLINIGKQSFGER